MCAAEVELAVKELGVELKQSPKELLALADQNNDQVSFPVLIPDFFTCANSLLGIVEPPYY